MKGAKNNMTGHVCVRTRYYKAGPALAILDHAHALRNGFTRSQNVISSLSHNNAGMYFTNAKSSSEAFERMCERYKVTTGKKCRSDFNALFEHILIFSEDAYSELERKYGSERLKRALLLQLKKYAAKIKQEFGFEPLGVDLHLDEGTLDQVTGQVKRNIHAHIQFFNYDFEKRVAPLRHLMRKGVDENGRTQQLNPNFVMMQDIAGDLFSNAGFKRGESKNVTGRAHLKKEEFVKEKLNGLRGSVDSLTAKNLALTEQYKLQKLTSHQLTEKINEKQNEYSWLTNQIQQLNCIQKDLKTAISRGCKQAISGLMRRSGVSYKSQQSSIKR